MRHPEHPRGLTLLDTLRHSAIGKWLFWLLCTLLCYGLATMAAEHRRNNFQQMVQLNRTLLNQQFDYLDLFLGQINTPDSDRLLQQNRQRFFSEHPAFVMAAGFQSKVDTGSRDAFEDSQSYQNRSPFLIREYRDQNSETWADSSAWFPAPARSEYIPLTRLSPSQPGNPLAYLQGLDLSSDRFFSSAIKSAVSSGSVQFSKAFRYRDGSPGLAMVRAGYQDDITPDTMVERNARARGIAVVFIDMNKLLAISAGSNIRYSVVHDSDIALNDGEPPSTWLWSLLSEQQQTLQSQRYPLPYAIRLTLPPLPWQDLLLPGLLALLTVLTLHYRLFQHRPRTRDEVVAAPATDAGPQIEQQILQALDEGVLLISPHRQILYANMRAAVLTGDSMLRGKLLDDVDFGICQQRNGRRVNLLTRLLEKQSKTALPDDSFLLDVEGKEWEVEGQFIPLGDDLDAPSHYLLSFRHIGTLRQSMAQALKTSETQLKKHQDELARIARINTLGEMSSGVAHEINQPLSAIMSYNEACLAMMDDVNPDPVLLRISLVSSVRQANRAGQIIRRLRELASRKLPVVSALDLNTALRNALDLTKSELSTREVVVTTDLAQNLPQVMADSIQLEQVIINLIKNAVDAMAEKGIPGEPMRIFAYTERRGRHIRLGIRDNGTGIPENILPHVFDPFYSSKSEGMGLGLTISQTIVESIGGKLAARNLETGGAEFSVTLPMLKSSIPDDHEEQQ